MLSLAVLAAAAGYGSDIYILSFDANPAGLDSGGEWVMLVNAGKADKDLEGWSFHTGLSGRTYPLKDFTIPAGQRRAYIHPSGWLRNENETIILTNAQGREIDRTPATSDTDNDNRFWLRHGAAGAADPDWRFELQTLAKGGYRTGTVLRVTDGDTLDIGPVDAAGVQTIRLVGIDTPELDTEEGRAMETLVTALCLGQEVILDVDDLDQYDKYNRIVGVVLMDGRNLNRELQADKRVQALIIPPSEFLPYAACTVAPEHPAAGEVVTFDASASYTLDPRAAIVSYAWEIEGEKIKASQTPTVTHIFPKPGSCQATLTVTDSDGRKHRCNSLQITVLISE